MKPSKSMLPGWGIGGKDTTLKSLWIFTDNVAGVKAPATLSFEIRKSETVLYEWAGFLISGDNSRHIFL